MNHKLGVVIGLALSLGVGVVGCSDESLPTGTPVAPSFFRTAPVPGFDVVKRTHALDTDLVKSVEIGVKGGKLAFPEAGIQLVFPEGALSRPTRVTVRAYAGDAVAFDFQPHGTQFARGVSVLLAMDGTTARGRLDRVLENDDDEDGVPVFDFVGTYFDGDPRYEAVTPLEIRPMYLLGGQLHFKIHHFSGYASASN